MKYLIFFFLSINLFGQSERLEPEFDEALPTVKADPRSTEEMLQDKNVIIKYKSEEYFDFDALRVEGEIITPADLSTRSNKRVRFNIKEHIRKNFDDFIREDLIDIH